MGKKQEQKETVTEIPLSKIKDFPDHPYQVKDDESMLELVESIKERGLIQPVLTLLYALFNSTIMPKVTEKVEGLFNYAG